MPYLVAFCIFVSGVFAEDFITQTEYAKMLYANPRGIGCDRCHGPKGEGRALATYKHKGEEKTLVAPPIHTLTKTEFIQGLNKTNSTMPTYFLTQEEIESLYHYVTRAQEATPPSQ